MLHAERPLTVGDWVYLPAQQTHGRIIERTALWGYEIYRVWLPTHDTTVRVRAEEIVARSWTPNAQHLAFVAAAARVADALTQDILLAPIEASVIPLPHQIRALSRAISSDRVRYLLADEVGLGKTIEAGLIMRELKLRGLVRRTLVIAPKSLLTQWVIEMRTHFGEEFRLLIPRDFSAYRRLVDDENLWRSHPQVVCSMDSVKPLEKRRGWSKEDVEEYNRERFEDLIAAGWDLVIVDEAHRLGGSTEAVARYKLGLGLAAAAPYVLLLSATPHQGKSDHFRRLLSLLDPDAFPDNESMRKELSRPYVIRTEKRRAIDAQGKPLFKPRRTELCPVAWGERHRDQSLLYEAVTNYVRVGYDCALRENRGAAGFLMILMQKLVVSSTRAIKRTLERRLEALKAEGTAVSQLPLFDESLGSESSLLSADDFYDLGGQEQLDLLLSRRLQDIREEEEEVRRILEIATRCEAGGPDAKAEALLDWIYRLQAEEGDPNLKLLVFTEFVATQEMLYEFLTERGFAVECLNGSMDLEERKRVQDSFARDARILVSTEAGGEGLNLQFCHVVINYDIPWNPMRLEQRIGRVDRIGQTHTVRAVNFVLAESIEAQVLVVLQQKLEVILREFGVDKTGDILDSAEAERTFNELYVSAILEPHALDTKVNAVIESIRAQAEEARKAAAELGPAEDLHPDEAQRCLAHPLPYWIERMTISYVQAHGGKAEKRSGAWDLVWPDGEQLTQVVFTAKDAEERPSCRRITLEDPKVRGLALRLPWFAPGQPIPVVTVPGLSSEIQGVWSLWEIALKTLSGLGAEPATLWRQRRVLPLFVADDGRVFAQTARYVWDRLLVAEPRILRCLDAETSLDTYQRLSVVAQQQGQTIFEELARAHRDRLERETEKRKSAFAARRRMIERSGRTSERNRRLSLLAEEEARLLQQLERDALILPEMAPLLLIRVEADHGS
jgi:superfamily II DNA or RNA helicase